MKQNYSKIRLQNKILLPTVSCILLSFVVISFVVSSQISTLMRINEHNWMENSRNMFLEKVENEQTRMQLSLRKIVTSRDLYDGYFGAIAEDTEYLANYLRHVMSMERIARIHVVDDEGVILYSTGGEEIGQPFHLPELLKKVLGIENITDTRAGLDQVLSLVTMVDRNMAKIFVTGPIIDIETVAGVVIFEFDFDDVYLKSLQQTVGSNLEIILGDGQENILATTWDGVTLEQIGHNEAGGYEEHNELHESTINGKSYDHLFFMLADTNIHTSLSYDVSENRAFVRNIYLILLASVLITMLVLVIVITLAVRRSISPLIQAVKIIRHVAEGDLRERIPVRSLDEIGELAEATNSLVERLGAMISKIKESADQLAGSAGHLGSVSGILVNGSSEMIVQSTNVAGGTEELSANINSIATSSEEMSVNIGNVSSTAEEMFTNMATVSTAVEQLGHAVEEIATSAQDGRKVATEAAEMSTSATSTMNLLGEAAREIGHVIEMIKRIAEQTNLLALNATIEAASAGEAGRGFAVVAGEIKELAAQSGKAAENITQRIGGIQDNSSEAIEAISGITEIISRMNTSVDTITTAVEEQTLSAGEITESVNQSTSGAQNIAMAIAEIAKGANEMSSNSSDAAQAANDISSSIIEVDSTARETNTRVKEINTAAENLMQVSTGLEEMINFFKIERREEERIELDGEEVKGG